MASTSTSKRKRFTKNPQAASYEIVHHSHPSTVQPSATSRTVTFDRNPSGRLGQYTEIAEVEISAEDLAALAQDPEFLSLPDDETLNYEFFEQTVQADDKEDEPAIHRVPAKDKNKVKPVWLHHDIMRCSLIQRPFIVRTFSRIGCRFVIHMFTS
jgi:hypothetical protein